ncbi:Grap2 and cyclin-D-interacting-domain-containing protein [Syncephalis fuscata]|nr:Grap2 and cyclin-D-interacting-domain-containing protein [Syncephalis fuscata]
MPSPISQMTNEQIERSKAVKSVLETLAQTCVTLREQTCEATAGTQFDGPLFVQHIGNLGTIISHQATKANLACKRGSIPGDAVGLIDQLQEALHAIQEMRKNAPISIGATLLKSITDITCELLDNTYDWANTLADGLKDTYTPEADEEIEAVARSKLGLVWNACKALWTIPSTNTEAVKRRWKSNANIINDAIDEFEEALAEDAKLAADPLNGLANEMEQLAIEKNEEEEDDDDKQLSPKADWEREICQCALASTKLVKRLLLKVEQRGISNEGALPKWQDDCLDVANALLSQVDNLGDLFWFLDSDVQKARIDAIHHLDLLYKEANKLAELASEQLTDQHKTWLELCMKQLDAQRLVIRNAASI